MEPTRIGFTGNRHGITQKQSQDILSVLNKYDNIIVSHGDCVGSDTDFHKLCVEYKKLNKDKSVTIHIYPPTNPSMRGFNTDGEPIIMPERPYLERNLLIVNNSSMLIACPVDKNREELRSGTWSTIRQAKKRGIHTLIF